MGVQYNTIENVPVASFETSWKNESANQPIKSVVAEITPTQDLHGYDYPWPAGGGKNLFDKTALVSSSTVDIEQMTDGFKAKQLSAGKYTSVALIIPFDGHDGESVYLKGEITNSGSNNGAVSVRCYDANNAEIGTFGDRIEIYANRPSHNKPVLTGTKKLVIVVYASFNQSGNANDVATFSNVILSLSDVPYSPYSNICPITGRTEATVWRMGKNLLDVSGRTPSSIKQNDTTIYMEGCTITKNGETLTAVVNGVWSKARFAMDTSKMIDGQQYTFSAQFLNPSGGLIGLGYFDGTRWREVKTSGETSVRMSIQFVYDSSPSLILAVIFNNTATNTGNTIIANDIMLETGATATPYTPYSGTSYPVSWQSEAGTVYGGTVDVVSGVLTVDRAMMYVDGSQNIYNVGYHGSSGLYYTVITNTLTSKEGDPSLISNRFRNGYNIGIGNCYVTDLGTTLVAVLPDQTITTREQARQWFVDNPTQFVYALATPQTYQLSGQHIKTLLGLNNVWADSGNIKKLMWQYTIFDLLRVFINGFEITDFIAFGGWQRERGDVDGPEAGRTLDARMHRARVATKMRYNVTCRPLLVEELSSLERLIMPEYVTVKVIGDPYYGTWEKTCYVNNTSSQYLIRKRNGAQWWGGITFPIIEV